jgi:hypothetical protein
MPMKTDRPFVSLDEAIRKLRLPDVNVYVMRHIVETIPVSALFEDSQRGVRLERACGGPDLWFTSGNASGFVSKEEALQAAPTCEVWPDAKVPGRWGVHLPQGRPNIDRVRQPRREGEACPQCFTARALDGTCLCD